MLLGGGVTPPPAVRPQAVQEVHGLLRVARRLKDRALVLAQDFHPVVQIRGMVLARLRRDAEESAQRNALPSSATSSSRA